MEPSVDSKTPIEKIDPSWAWEPWKPSPAEPWDDARVRLLFRRGGFGAGITERKEAIQRGPEHALRMLYGEGSNRSLQKLEQFEQESDSLAASIRAGGSIDALAAWWMHRILFSPSPVVEKLTLFWHGHFATGAEKVMDSELMFTQNRTLRNHAVGDFRAMVHAISKDPAMLIYLDSVTNRKSHPNENYARELMELFCLGEGNYRERDVQELARCFTGWEIRRKMFRFNPYQHDDGTKEILGRSEVESGEQAIDVVLDQPSMPRFIARKLFRYLVCDEPQAPDALIEPLAEHFVRSQYSIRAVVDRILSSRMLLSSWSIGRKVRSPVDLAAEFLRGLSATTNLERLTKMLKPLGQGLFYPPNVKGWDGGRTWINSSTLIGRANFAVDLLSDPNTRFGGLALDAWCSAHGIPHSDWLDWLEQTFLSVPLSQQEKERCRGDSRGAVFALLARNPKIHLS
ncbi:MAG: DUF1800 family protein [Planctomycetota bacterium]